MTTHCYTCEIEKLDAQETKFEFIARFFVRVSRKWKLRQQQRLDRRSFGTLLSLDDRQLNDIGVTRAEVEWASQLPLEKNAALELEKLARRDGIMKL